jgi:hypothetical protein
MHLYKMYAVVFLLGVVAMSSARAQEITLQYKFQPGTRYLFSTDFGYRKTVKLQKPGYGGTWNTEVYVDSVLENGNAMLTVTVRNEKHLTDKKTVIRGKKVTAFARQGYYPTKYQVLLAPDGRLLSGSILERSRDEDDVEGPSNADDSAKQRRSDSIRVGVFIDGIFKHLPEREHVVAGCSWSDTVKTSASGKGKNDPRGTALRLDVASLDSTQHPATPLEADGPIESTVTISHWSVDSVTHSNGVRCLKLTRKYSKKKVEIFEDISAESTTVEHGVEYTLLRGSDGALLMFDLDQTREWTVQDTSSDVDVGSDGSPGHISTQEEPSRTTWRVVLKDVK